ncbi:hypothetical protein [Rhizobium gallicum]|uniref:hypothetical protein n=1 Tax=Rhizobium gallicum TaxID=56730 RepID=UPI001EF8DCE0|nr:hypothetical protein [Rhizobium gallicum]ULJ74170.1 hypothetical protein L2W42_19290 [Rhizobium gallicum]
MFLILLLWLGARNPGLADLAWRGPGMVQGWLKAGQIYPGMPVETSTSQQHPVDLFKGLRPDRADRLV